MENEKYYEKIGKNVKKYRQKENLTQEKLAELSQMSLDYIGKIEVGINRPGLCAIFKIAKALKIEPYKLLK